jgi:hypothetical protein
MRLPGLMRSRVFLVTAVLALTAGAGTASAGAQAVGQNKQPGSSDTPTISGMAARLVIETVTVKDKKGAPIAGLTDKDFTVTEDGVAQKISFCEYQSLPETTTALPMTPEGAGDVKLFNRLGRTQISGETPGQVMYRDKRLMALYFDMTAMPQEDQIRALEAAQKFVRQDMTTADLVSIMRYAGTGVEVLQDFTSDRDRLLSILETMVVGEGQGLAGAADDSSSADTGAAFGRRCGVQHLYHGPATVGVADGGGDAGTAERKEDLDPVCQRPDPEWAGQPGAAARDRGGGHPGGGVVLDDRLARAGGAGGSGRCDPRFVGRLSDVYRRCRDGDVVAVCAVAGHAVCAGDRYGREGVPG